MARLDRPERGRIKALTNTLEPSRSDPIPAISRDLLEYLEKRFPDALPEEGSDLKEVWARWGTRRVVYHLREVYRQQQEQEEDLPNVLLPKINATGD